MRERSLREARAIARLNHANVVRIFDVLRTDGDPWIVMEYVASKSLQDTLAEDGPVSVARTVEIGLGVLGALKRRAQGGRHAPRRQAGQRAARRRRPGGADRFRSRHDPGRPQRDPHRHGARLAGVHLAGAGPGRHRRAGGRPVVAGRDALRGGGGQVAVRPAVGDRHPGRAGHRADPAAEERRPAQGRAQRAAPQGPERADHRRGGGAVAAPRRGQAGARDFTARWRTPAGAERSARAAPAGGAGTATCRECRPAGVAAAGRRREHLRRDLPLLPRPPPPTPRRRPSFRPVWTTPTRPPAVPAEPTATIDRPSDAEPTTKVAATGDTTGDGTTNTGDGTSTPTTSRRSSTARRWLRSSASRRRRRRSCRR